MVYQLFSPMKGTGMGIVADYFVDCLYPSIMFSLLFFGILRLYIAILSNLVLQLDIRIGKIQLHFMNSARSCAIGKLAILEAVFGILSVCIKKQAMLVGIPVFIEEISTASTIYEQEYIDPRDVEIIFPERKRNLILIYMESMEMTYASRKAGGGKPEGYIPGLTKLAGENVNFSDDDNLGGAGACDGAGWTIAGLLASSSGVNYKLPIQINSADKYQEFLKGLVAIGDILEDAGYQNYFMCGSDAEFAGRREFYEQHGSYHIYDLITARENGIVPEDYHNGFWGMEDRYLYGYAKQKLMEIADDGRPFDLTMLTVDTHHPEGYICSLCEDSYPEPFANAIVCADRQVCDFLDWASKQEWYEDTTIVITGDHISMVTDFWEDINGYDRKIYNCFINVAAPVTAENTRNRKFSSLDMFPTILTAMGVRVEGGRLGLGTDLFSGAPTLPEMMGWEAFNEEIGQYSDYYFRHFIIGEGWPDR